MAQEKFNTTITVATTEPKIDTHSIEDMLALPEAPSAVLEAEARQRRMRESLPAFMEYLFEERRDVFGSWCRPMIEWTGLLDRTGQHKTTESGVHFIPRQDPTPIYKPPPKPAEHSPLEDVYTSWDWSRRATALFNHPDAHLSAEEKQAAFEAAEVARQAGQEFVDRFVFGVGGSQSRLQIKNAGDDEWTSLGPIRSFRFVSEQLRPVTAQLPSNPFWAGSMSDCQAEAKDRQEAEIKFELPAGTLNVACMCARTATLYMQKYVDQHPDATQEQKVGFALTLSRFY